MKAINDQTPMLELQHIVKLILDKVEVDIHKFDNKNRRHERKQQGVALERDCTTKTTRQHLDVNMGATR